MSYILGIDPSLTGTGVATRYRSTRIDVRHIQVEGRQLHTLLRRRWICGTITDRWLTGVRLAVIEGMYPRMQSGQHDRAALHGDIVDKLDRRGIHVVTVPPTVLKQYATGNGAARKDDMIRQALLLQLGAPATDDEADALWLCALGHELAGDRIVQLPAAQIAVAGNLSDDAWLRGRPDDLQASR